MKLLLDEHLPHDFRHEIVGHDVFTVAYMGWSGVENGDLLTHAEREGFDAVISNDGGMQHEQNLVSLPVSVVFLDADANTLEALRPLVPELLNALRTLVPHKYIVLQH